MDEVAIGYKVDNLSVVFGLLKFTEMPVSFNKDGAFYKVESADTFICWLTADEFRILDDSGMIGD